LFLLELSGGRIQSMNPDGSNREIIVTDYHLARRHSLGADADHIYWTNVGVPNLDYGSIERVEADGQRTRIRLPLAMICRVLPGFSGNRRRVRSN
jgi:hypothetical protein